MDESRSIMFYSCSIIWMRRITSRRRDVPPVITFSRYTYMICQTRLSHIDKLIILSRRWNCLPILSNFVGKDWGLPKRKGESDISRILSISFMFDKRVGEDNMHNVEIDETSWHCSLSRDWLSMIRWFKANVRHVTTWYIKLSC